MVLTGLLNDGTSGMWSVKRLGGCKVIQEPDDAMYASMPESVIQHVEVDYNVRVAELAALLGELIQENIPDRPNLSQAELPRMATEIKIAAQENTFELGILELGTLTPLTCPECSGALVSIQEGTLIRYRCVYRQWAVG